MALNGVGAYDSEEENVDLYYGIPDDNEDLVEMEKKLAKQHKRLVQPQPKNSTVYFPSVAYFKFGTDEPCPCPSLVKTTDSSPEGHSVKSRNFKLNSLNNDNRISESEERDSSTSSDSSPKKNSLELKSLQRGRDARRFQKALNCYMHRLKKQSIGDDELSNLRDNVASLQKLLGQKEIEAASRSKIK